MGLPSDPLRGTGATDPRRGSGAAEADPRPTVALPPARLPIWVMAVGVAIVAVLLFSSLNARRQALTAPPGRAGAQDTIDTVRSPPPLVVPPEPAPPPVEIVLPPRPPIPQPLPRYRPPPPQPRIVYVPAPAPVLSAAPPSARVSNDPAVILDVGVGPAVVASSAGTEGSLSGEGAGTGPAAAARATVLRHRPTTVAQGTLIPAILETALDSTRPGLARALVSRDVRGFDGTRVLVPRGSRLLGEYRGVVQPGQNRALIVWSKLVRPDGVTIAIASPVADTLGRAGVRGKVNSHFLERFGAAILQSTLDVGVGLASRLGNNNSSVVLALPGASSALSQPLSQNAQIAPTLRVRQGTSISVFVARDLDFTAVENGR